MGIMDLPQVPDDRVRFFRAEGPHTPGQVNMSAGDRGFGPGSFWYRDPTITSGYRYMDTSPGGEGRALPQPKRHLYVDIPRGDLGTAGYLPFGQDTQAREFVMPREFTSKYGISDVDSWRQGRLNPTHVPPFEIPDVRANAKLIDQAQSAPVGWIDDVAKRAPRMALGMGALGLGGLGLDALFRKEDSLVGQVLGWGG